MKKLKKFAEGSLQIRASEIFPPGQPGLEPATPGLMY